MTAIELVELVSPKDALTHITKPTICKSCMHLKKLMVRSDEHGHFIALACGCSERRLSQYYDKVQDARLDWSSLSWRS